MDCNSPPVLLLIFNRPDLLAKCFKVVREAKPRELFIAADGPREGNSGDSVACEECREIVNKVDWNCEVHTLFREKNLGCREAVSTAITWFFEHVEAGIILEDDCLADISFFSYCYEMLEHYKDDSRIMCVTGNNFQNTSRTNASYYFSVFPHCWGWASWRRAWKYYDEDMRLWPEMDRQDVLRHILWDNVGYWRGNFQKTYDGEINTWDYVWMMSCLAHHGLTVTPDVNLVVNIGFDGRATHTTDPAAQYAVSLCSIGEISHPEMVVRDYEADYYVNENYFGANEERDLKDKHEPHLLEKLAHFAKNKILKKR